MRLTRRGRIVVWIIYFLIAVLLGAGASNFCWTPDGRIARCEQVAAELAWVSDAATEIK